MSVFDIFLNGIKKTIDNLRMWLILFGVQLVFAVVLLRPLGGQLDKMLGHSLMGQDVLKGIGMQVFLEFIIDYGQSASLEVKLIWIIGLIYLVTSIFFNGGILGVFVRDEQEFSAHRFFGNAGRYFGRFLRLFLFSIVFIIAALLIHTGLGALFNSIAGDSEPLRILFLMIKTGILLFLLFFINMVFDYAKIGTVFRDRKRMCKTALQSWVFVFQNLGRTLKLYYLVALLGLLCFVMYSLVGKLFGPSTSLGILLLLIWQQMYAFCRIGVRLNFYASQTILYKKLTEPYLKAWFKEDTT